jgi:hypothetical protein
VTTSVQYTAAKGRKFALTIAIAFGVLALISFWRGRQTPPLILGGLAAILALAGLAVPSKLSPLESAWMKLAHALSKVTTPIFMGIVYFVLLTPIGFIRRSFGGNPLAHKAVRESYWIARAAPDAGKQRSRMERQF